MNTEIGEFPSASVLRTTLASRLYERIGDRGYIRKDDKLQNVAYDNATDFKIEIGFLVSRGSGGVTLSAYFNLWWDIFEKEFLEFKEFFEGGEKMKRGRQHEFLTIEFDQIYFKEKKMSRHGHFIKAASQIGDFVELCARDYDECLGGWIRNWFTWESAYSLMTKDRDLCGAWRTVAFFCVTKQARDDGAACQWLRGENPITSLKRAQIEFLMTKHCKGLLNNT